MEEKKAIMEVGPWDVSSKRIEKNQRRLQESLTSIGNGYMGMRGNFSEKYSGDMHQGTYIGGVWFPDKTRVGWWKNGYPEYFGKAINALNFGKINILIDGHELDLYEDQVADFYLNLDLKKGILTYTYVFSGVRVSAERFFSLKTKEFASFALNFEVVDARRHDIRLESSIDGDVTNEDSNYEEGFWQILGLGSEELSSWLATETKSNPFGIEQFTVIASQNYQGDFPLVKQASKDKEVVDYFARTIIPTESLNFEKRVVVTTSRDYKDFNDNLSANREISQRVNQISYEDHYDDQVKAWGERWQHADVCIRASDDRAQQGIRFNLFQLFSTYYGEDDRLNIGPKGFTGEKYGGATYWDTEAYAIPLYLSLADEKVSLNLLKYRRRQLEEARHNARMQGLNGALYPMVTFNGVECHNEWEITFEEIHRNGAIAYAIYNYSNYTGDESYLAHEGLEVLVEISRFWADRVHYSKRQEKYMIHGVTGPNEYENNINNNWYTNTLARWVLSYTMEALSKYPRPELEVTPSELERWQDIIEKMYLPFDEDLGIFVQHDTFLDKDLRPVSALDPADLPLNQNWSWDKILRSPFIKQADVLQGIYFFGNKYSLEEKRRNFNFYEPMTVHESSLSPSIHSILAAELGMEEKALQMYERTARLDLDNFNNDTEDGLHITSMTGSWLAIVQGFAQMKTWEGKLSFAPFLPAGWEGYTFHINYRGRLLKVDVEKNLSLSLLSGEALELELYGQKIFLEDYYKTELRENLNKEG
ncbi:glycoside hydrolase family 65 protein [Streptococcaceae bacterium ESL0729]|nr:glycoside hydrolase family 65 protein [Streptococcaceae bacterium ESL0729]